MFDGSCKRRQLMWYVVAAAGAIGLVSWYLVSQSSVAYDVSSRTYEQNLANLGATDVCEMLPMRQFGNPFDNAGNRISPTMTVYLHAPKGRRPKTGDFIEIKYPEELKGRLLFTQTANDGFGGSGSLEWVDQQSDAQLAMAVWDFTFSGSLQYSHGDVRLWGDCKKLYELKTKD